MVFFNLRIIWLIWIILNNQLSFKGGTGGGPSTTREEKIKTIVDDIMEKLPDPFSMSEIMGKVEERTPYVVVAFQVIIIRAAGTYECMRTRYHPRFFD